MRSTEPRGATLGASLGALTGFSALAWALLATAPGLGSRMPDLAGGLFTTGGITGAAAPGAGLIWFALFPALAGYLIWQWLPRQRAQRMHARLRPWAVGSIVLGALWLQLLQWRLLGPGLAAALALDAVLAVAVLRIATTVLRNRTDRRLTRTTFGVYFGWILICSVANASAWLHTVNFEPLANLVGIISALLVLLTGLAVAAMTFRNPMGIFVNIGSLWAVTWIAVERAVGVSTSPSMGISASVAAALLVISLLGSVRRRVVRALGEPSSGTPIQ